MRKAFRYTIEIAAISVMTLVIHAMGDKGYFEWGEHPIGK